MPLIGLIAPCVPSESYVFSCERLGWFYGDRDLPALFIFRSLFPRPWAMALFVLHTLFRRPKRAAIIPGRLRRTTAHVCQAKAKFHVGVAVAVCNYTILTEVYRHTVLRVARYTID